MKSPEHWLVHEHTQLELLFRQLHDAADISDWWAAERFFLNLAEQLRYHMAQEEKVLFPAYDAKYKISQSSSPVSTLELHDEHSLMIEKFCKLEECIESKKSECVLSNIIFLEELIIEHHEKEEQVFLPFASHLLFEDRDELSQELNEFAIEDSSINWKIKVLKK